MSASLSSSAAAEWMQMHKDQLARQQSEFAIWQNLNQWLKTNASNEAKCAVMAEYQAKMPCFSLSQHLSSVLAIAEKYNYQPPPAVVE